MSNIRVYPGILEPAEYPGFGHPPKTRGFQVKPEPVMGFARPGCTRRVPPCLDHPGYTSTVYSIIYCRLLLLLLLLLLLFFSQHHFHFPA